MISSLEAYASDASEIRSFFPVIYVYNPGKVSGFAPATRTSPTVLFLLPTTDNVRALTRDVDGVAMVSREWALLDSLASPGRQPDVSLHLLNDLLLAAHAKRIHDIVSDNAKDMLADLFREEA